jgi:plasmid stability protein
MPGVASITIRRLDEGTKARLRIRAAHNGRSMEEEARTLLKAALTEDIAAIARLAGAALATRNRGDFEGCGLTVVNPWEV